MKLRIALLLTIVIEYLDAVQAYAHDYGPLFLPYLADLQTEARNYAPDKWAWSPTYVYWTNIRVGTTGTTGAFGATQWQYVPPETIDDGIMVVVIDDFSLWEETGALTLYAKVTGAAKGIETLPGEAPVEHPLIPQAESRRQFYFDGEALNPLRDSYLSTSCFYNKSNTLYDRVQSGDGSTVERIATLRIEFAYNTTIGVLAPYTLTYDLQNGWSLQVTCQNQIKQSATLTHADGFTMDATDITPFMMVSWRKIMLTETKDIVYLTEDYYRLHAIDKATATVIKSVDYNDLDWNLQMPVVKMSKVRLPKLFGEG